jgi:hypothetical protein
MRPASGGFESPSFFSKFYSKHGQARDEIPFQMNSAMSGTVEDIEGQPVQTTELKASYEIDCTDQLKDLSNMDADLGNLPSKVVIFSRSTCPYCLELKRSLGTNQKHFQMSTGAVLSSILPFIWILCFFKIELY